ncbi:MAG: hypothetical protein ACJA2W_001785 [Planctomycetota bacterium]|jgi:hypothetical protein
MQLNVITPAALTVTAALLLAAAGPDDSVQLRFAPTAGTVTTHAIEIGRSVEAGDLAVSMNGEEVNPQYLPELFIEYTTATTAEITDHFLPAEDDIAGLWRRRTTEGLQGSFDMGLSMGEQDMEMSAEATSELDGAPFLIGRNADDEVVARWADSDNELSTELLDSVRPEFQPTGLLPKDPVGTDDTWEADASALSDLLGLSDSLPWTWSGADAGSIPATGETTYEGDLTLRLVDIRTEDDVVLCTIALSGDLIETETKPGDLSQAPVEGTATDTTTTTYVLKGEFVWNVSAHHLASLELTGEGEGEQLTVKDAGQPGPEYSSTVQHTATLSVLVR